MRYSLNRLDNPSMKIILFMMLSSLFVGFSSFSFGATVWQIDFNGQVNRGGLVTTGATSDSAWNNIGFTTWNTGSNAFEDRDISSADQDVSNGIKLSMSGSFTSMGLAGNFINNESFEGKIPPSVITGTTAPATAWGDGIFVGAGNSMTLTFSGLAAGTYSLNGFSGASSLAKGVFSLNGADSSEITAAVGTGAALSWSDIVVGEDGTLSLTVTSTEGNLCLNFLQLTQNVPEPSTALLSCLSLGGIFLRRRRS